MTDPILYGIGIAAFVICVIRLCIRHPQPIRSAVERTIRWEPGEDDVEE